ncbi:MAG TPA: hypothetical protein VGC26_06215 [Afipia sp.]
MSAFVKNTAAEIKPTTGRSIANRSFSATARLAAWPLRRGENSLFPVFS